MLSRHFRGTRILRLSFDDKRGKGIWREGCRCYWPLWSFQQKASPAIQRMVWVNLLGATVLVSNTWSIFECTTGIFCPYSLICVWIRAHCTIANSAQKSKKGAFNMSNYRSTLVATITARVLDVCLTNDLLGTLQLSDNQFGFNFGSQTLCSILHIKKLFLFTFSTGRRRSI